MQFSNDLNNKSVHNIKIVSLLRLVIKIAQDVPKKGHLVLYNIDVIRKVKK